MCVEDPGLIERQLTRSQVPAGSDPRVTYTIKAIYFGSLPQATGPSDVESLHC
jgi:hypothetical protein